MADIGSILLRFLRAIICAQCLKPLLQPPRREFIKHAKEAPIKQDNDQNGMLPASARSVSTSFQGKC
jgi:hypothetical protein